MLFPIYFQHTWGDWFGPEPMNLLINRYNKNTKIFQIKNTQPIINHSG